MESSSSSPEPDPKRRKLRKGTRSCWDCKKRKVKCTFDSTSTTVCVPCHRRGTACIGQDQPEELNFDSSRDPLVRRIARIETLLEQLIELGHNVDRKVALAGLHLPTTARSGYFTPASDVPCEPSDQISSTAVRTDHVVEIVSDESRVLSESLIKAFPAQSDIDTFCKSNYIATFYCHQLVTRSAERSEHEAHHFVDEIAKIPDPSKTPPVLIAKRMMILALFLQYLRCQQDLKLQESPIVIADRLVDTAVRFITTDDRGFGCIEGLECIILGGVYETNNGNLRKAWLTMRKAMVIAQLMKVDLPNPPPIKILDPSSHLNPRFMWFRIVYMDANLSLMLGLPYGGQMTTMDEGSQDETPPCRLERVHTIVSRRISDRNRNPNFAQDLETTRQLDKELLDASRALPDTFWSPPDFEDILPDTREGFVRTMHLCDQFHHHNLVHLLHLPYLLRNEKQSSFYVYSKITCLNACRDLIQGFVAFRKFYCNILAVYCRTGDFMALMAGMTILLAHIDSHKLGVRDWRAHQRASDRGLVEQLCRIMEKVARQTNDNITNEAATQLRRLMIIESDASRGMNTSTESTLACLEEHCGQFKLTIPYFGIIKIDREGVTKDVPAEADLCQPQFPSNPASVHVANHVLTAAGYDYTLPPQQPQMSMLLAEDNTGQISAPQLHGTMNNAYIELNQPQTQLPGVAASINDWTFQGVDAAFFESVMRGTSGWDSPLPTDL